MRNLLFAIAVLAVGPSLVSAAMPSQALRDYVTKSDASYGWKVRTQGELGQTQYAEVRLTSQTWKDIPWKHQLFVIKPSTVRANTKHALLFVAGGSWQDSLDSPDYEVNLPREAQLFAQLAERMQAPVAILLHVPQQPIFDGKREDQIIAFTFEQYLKTGDAEWPLLLPMVKSAVRGMDATQAYLKEHNELDIETFTVAGASKRGWTTWLTGAVDSRVTALAPIVIDVLNMSVQMNHQRKAWGKPSHMIEDYTRRGLIDALQTERGKRLLAIVDPYAHLQQIRQPKLLIIGTNDQYWPVDALNNYWEEVTGPKYILYVPNRGHDASDYARLLGSINALNQHAATGRALPEMKWDFQQVGKKLTLDVSADTKPEKFQAWIAKSKTRDFRNAKWSAVPMEARQDGFRHVIDAPESGCVAMFGEGVFATDAWPCFFSTNVRILTAEPAVSSD